MSKENSYITLQQLNHFSACLLHQSVYHHNETSLNLLSALCLGPNRFSNTFSLVCFSDLDKRFLLQVLIQRLALSDGTRKIFA